MYLAELDSLGDKWDVAFTGECLGLHIAYVYPDRFFYDWNTSRGTCMYIMNRHRGPAFYKAFLEGGVIDKQIDHWFNLVHKSGAIRYLWSEPTLVAQGSDTGMFPCSIPR